MEIIYKGNKHKEPKPERMYGCTCPNCDSVFTFQDSEVCRPKMSIFVPAVSLNDYAKKYYTITCPTCNNTISLDKCVIFKDTAEEVRFKLTHEPVEKENK
ncbi:hypothetical protein [Clostridium sp. AF32-12BH]|uniref:hypothetical protein n=1 Tax=Clostridium sp. AF32-12BH TaxID=2292006 RepID=UPI000E51A91A|nr:hypothetical protein [Clostridium sp. AF32-12BH]RHP46879.1 hypothetical protein DWZ40_08210 [Clostridium sp. AF32-12BH]